ncbi:MAG TPA: NAD(P)-binding domain-containing protein [Longimicrobiales bacterium]|nr:NAD(P)-binding domain-containing protein [Longimicrobiales bacterium]
MDPVCIIGAGPAGLAAAVALQARGIPFRILDAGRAPGGIWDMDRPDTPMYTSAHFISSKTLSGFRDFPMPADYPDYPRHDQILAYVRDYARRHGLEDHATFGMRVTRARPVEGGGAPGDGTLSSWEVEWVPVDPDAPTPDAAADQGPAPAVSAGRFSALVVAGGVTWHPNVPEIPGAFTGEIRHSVTYRTPDEFRGRRVLIVGGGNSAVDIACDAARAADAAFISLRRGYHFVPKYVFGIPADVFSHTGPRLPAWLEQRVFGFLVSRILVGDLTRYGLPRPDHPILSSHPIMNTQLLHHLGHGDIRAKPDVARFQGNEVVFADDSRETVDLVLLATGYRRRFPFLDLRLPGERRPFREAEVSPEDLYLTLMHRRFGTLFLMGIFETDGAAYDLFGEQADLVARTLEAVAAGGTAAERLARLRLEGQPDLRGGRRYLDTPRHTWYVKDAMYRKAIRRLRHTMGWD